MAYCLGCYQVCQFTGSSASVEYTPECYCIRKSVLKELLFNFAWMISPLDGITELLQLRRVTKIPVLWKSDFRGISPGEVNIPVILLLQRQALV